MQSRIYVIYNSNAYSRAYSGIQRCCGPLCIPRCAMCILKYTTHRAANTEHKGRLPTKHIASHNTNSTEGPLWGSPHICSKYREQLGARRTINVQTFNWLDIIIVTSSLMGNNGWKFPGVCPLRSTEGELISDCRCKRARRMPPPTMQCKSVNVSECVWVSVEFVWVCITGYPYYWLVQASATHVSSYNVGVCECVWSLCECVYLYYRLVQASVTYAVLGVCRCVCY